MNPSHNTIDDLDDDDFSTTPVRHSSTEDMVLTPDQQLALDQFTQFLYDPKEQVFVIRGYSGTGKSTLISTLLDRLPSYIQASKLIDPDYECPEVALTATTHKAADNFSQITGMPVCTIHSFLGLRLITDYTTGEKVLRPAKGSEPRSGYLLFIDEASYIDHHLLGLIFSGLYNCKIVFIGDPAQLLAPKCMSAPVFDKGYAEARLTKVMRQMVDGVPQENAITALATLFRHTVETGEWPKNLKIEGECVQWMPRDQFNQAIEAEFTRSDWHFKDSKVLAWTNNCAIAYNKHIRSLLKGDPSLAEGDYAENNSYIKVGNKNIATDATVHISKMEPESSEMGVVGNWVLLDHSIRVFFPRDRKEKLQLAARLRKEGNFQRALEVDNWVDLRAVFAQTVNKSQGSTYGTVFVDLDDIKNCTNGNIMARLLYVGISRGRFRCVLTGDLV